MDSVSLSPSLSHTQYANVHSSHRKKQTYWFMLQMDTSLIHFAKLKKSVSKRLQHSKILLYNILKKAKQQGCPTDPWLPETVESGGRLGQGRPTALPMLFPALWTMAVVSVCTNVWSLPYGRQCRWCRLYEEGVPGSFVPPFRLPSCSPFLAWDMRRAHRGSEQTPVHESIYLSGRGVCGPPQVRTREEKGGQL